jgi:hypothetical protein
MPSPGILHRVALARTNVSEKCIASIIKVTRIVVLWTLTKLATEAHCEEMLLVTANVVPSSPILPILMMEAIRSSEASALTRTWRLHIPEDGILQLYVTLLLILLYLYCNLYLNILILGICSLCREAWRIKSSKLTLYLKLLVTPRPSEMTTPLDS